MTQNKVDILLKINTEMRDLLRAQKEAQEFRKQFVSMGKMGAAFLGVQMGVQAITRALHSSIGEGLRFNRMIQDTTSSIEAMLLASGKMENISEASNHASLVMEQLRRRVNETGGSLQTLLNTFQRSAGLAQESGIQLEHWANVVTEASVAAANLGIRAGELETYLRQIARGSVPEDNRLAKVIGLDAETLRHAIEAGTAIDVIRAKLAPWQTEVTGMAAAQARLGNAISEMWGRIALPLFEQLEGQLVGFTASLEKSRGAGQSFGEVMGDAVRIGGGLLRLMIDLAPVIKTVGMLWASWKVAGWTMALAKMATAIWANVTANTALATSQKAVQLNSFGAALARVSFAATTATGVMGRLNAVVRAVGVSLRAMFIANPFGIILTAITALIGGLYMWDIRQREINRQLREARQETERIRLASRDRVQSLTTEESRQQAIRDVTEQILELERKITNEKNARVREELRTQRQLLEAQRRAAEELTDHDLRQNARRIEAERRRQADLAALPDRIAEADRRAEERRLAGLSATDRVRELEAKRAGLAERTGGASLEQLRAELDELDRLAAAGPDLSDRFRRSLANPDGIIASSEREDALKIIQDFSKANDEQRAMLSARLDAANELAAVEADLAEARSNADAEAARMTAEIQQLTIEAIRLAEREQQQSYDRAGTNTSEHYAQMTALAAERWDREITAAKAAGDAEADALKVSNLERQKSLELADLALRRDRDLERQARRTYEIRVEQIRQNVELLNAEILKGGDVGRRTELERTRLRLIEDANRLFAEYRAQVESLGLPERDLAAAPEIEAPEYERVNGLQRIIDQMGDTMENLDRSILSVGESLRDSIGGAIEGLILKTQTLGEAFRNIAVSFGQSIVRAFADMVAQWIVAKTAMFVQDKVFGAASLALLKGKSLAAAAAWAPAATLATIATYGTAAAMAPGQLAASMAASQSLSMAGAGFESGGYTPDGSPSTAVGVVHAGEWVSPQWMVKHPQFSGQIAALEQARRKRGRVGYSLPRGGYGAGGYVTAPATPVASDASKHAAPSRIILVDGRDQAERLSRDPNFRNLVVEIGRQHRNTTL